MEEVWKSVPDYEWYQVSNMGRVRSIDREFVNSIGRRCFLKGVMNKPRICKGYYRLGIRQKGEKKMVNVHRLVALAFIPNPFNYATVNHINGNKLDNRVENLEWCSAKENILHAYKNNLNGYVEKSNAKLRKINEINSYKLIEVTSPNGVIFKFNSTKEASEYFGVKIITINEALIKAPHRAFGYTYKGYK